MAQAPERDTWRKSWKDNSWGGDGSWKSNSWKESQQGKSSWKDKPWKSNGAWKDSPKAQNQGWKRQEWTEWHWKPWPAPRVAVAPVTGFGPVVLESPTGGPRPIEGRPLGDSLGYWGAPRVWEPAPDPGAAWTPPPPRVEGEDESGVGYPWAWPLLGFLLHYGDDDEKDGELPASSPRSTKSPRSVTTSAGSSVASSALTAASAEAAAEAKRAMSDEHRIAVRVVQRVVAAAKARVSVQAAAAVPKSGPATLPTCIPLAQLRTGGSPTLQPVPTPAGRKSGSSAWAASAELDATLRSARKFELDRSADWPTLGASQGSPITTTPPGFRWQKKKVATPEDPPKA